jgi:signal peptidase I|tara:strand:+ start:1470 stop:1604 length:135 start_codon:yes stop_codon:yes gene_type:complete
MNLLKDLWAHIKEWSDWKMKDWIKAAIVAIVVLFIISKMMGGAA